MFLTSYKMYMVQPISHQSFFSFPRRLDSKGSPKTVGKGLDKKEKSSQTATKVVQLQQMLPSARVIYCSATSVSHPRNLGFMRWVTFILFVFAEYYLCFMYHVVNYFVKLWCGLSFHSSLVSFSRSIHLQPSWLVGLWHVASHGLQSIYRRPQEIGHWCHGAPRHASRFLLAQERCEGGTWPFE